MADPGNESVDLPGFGTATGSDVQSKDFAEEEIGAQFEGIAAASPRSAALCKAARRADRTRDRKAVVRAVISALSPPSSAMRLMIMQPRRPSPGAVLQAGRLDHLEADVTGPRTPSVQSVNSWVPYKAPAPLSTMPIPIFLNFSLQMLAR